MIHLYVHLSSFHDAEWWKADYAPESPPVDEDTDASDEEEEEEEGELDSAGRLFLDLINSEATAKDPSTDNPAFIVPGPSDPAADEMPGPQTAEPPTLKRTRATVAKVSYSRLSDYAMNTSQSQAHTHRQRSLRKKLKPRRNLEPGLLQTRVP